MYTASKEIVKVFTEGFEDQSQVNTIVEMIEGLSSQEKLELTKILRKRNSFGRKDI